MSENPAKWEKKLSREILSVLLIVSADFYLQQSTRQHISIEDQNINWDAFQVPTQRLPQGGHNLGSLHLEK